MTAAVLISAIHEAGHLMVNHVLGGLAPRSSVALHGGGGWSRLRRTDPTTDGAADLYAIAALLAGMVAEEQLANVSSRMAVAGARHDIGLVASITSDPATFDRGMALAEGVVDQHSPAILALASVLAHKGRLAGKELADAIFKAQEADPIIARRRQAGATVAYRRRVAFEELAAANPAPSLADPHLYTRLWDQAERQALDFEIGDTP